MDRWRGILKVPLSPKSPTVYRVGASLCLSPSSNTLTVPCANAIFFNGDRVEGSSSPVIEKLSNLENLAEIVASKFGASVNTWIIEASVFNGPFAVYKDFIPSLDQYGDSKSCNPIGFPASKSTILLLSSCLNEVEGIISSEKKELHKTHIIPHEVHCNHPKTILLGFSKGGTVINQLVTELAFSNSRSGKEHSDLEHVQIIPRTEQSLLKSIAEIHYVDVGLNKPGAYITDKETIKGVSDLLVQGGGCTGIRFVLHGTPRQWCDRRRAWIGKEKGKMVNLLESEAKRNEGRLLQVCERFYFADRPPDLQMHFEIIEVLDVS